MSKKIYCGIEELKKDQVRGTVSQCSKMKQIRYYGVNELVSKDTADEYKGIPQNTSLKERRLIKLMGFTRGKIFKLDDEINELQKIDDDLKKKKYTDEIKKMTEERTLAKSQLSNVLKKLKEFRAEEAAKPKVKKAKPKKKL